MIHESFKYLVSNSKDRQWGLTITSAGTAKVGPSTVYPSTSHPKGYFFKPEKGRTLYEYALVYITAGEGKLETHSGGKFNLKAGDKVTVYGPFGEFFAKKTDAEMVFIGGGADMAPMR